MVVSNINNSQFCVKSNMTRIFIKNSIYQPFLDNTKEERIHWNISGGGDVMTLIITAHNKNAHDARASEVLGKNELLSMRAKDFQHKP